MRASRWIALLLHCAREFEASFVEEVHHGQYDKLGVPYVLHPVAVAEQMTTEKEILVALLHDVVEDTSVTLDDLRDRGYTDEVVAAVDILTRRSGEPYSTYIERVSTSELARRVKLADLQHNLQPDRVKLLGNDTLVNGEELIRRVVTGSLALVIWIKLF